MNHQVVISSLINWVQQTTPKGTQVLIPVSGGSDSALCYWFYAQALPGQAKGIYIGTDLRAKAWFEGHGEVDYSNVRLVGVHSEVERWAHFLMVSIQENRILVGSRNKTEEVLGTFSHASKLASILPLAGLWKHEVMELCEFVGVPREIIASSYRADPECGRPARMSDIPFTIVDAFLQSKLDEGSLQFQASNEHMAYLEKVYSANAYKRELPLKGLSLDEFNNTFEH